MNDTPPPDDPRDFDGVPDPAPGGPYFGRLLIALFAAIAFCALLTWYLASTVH